MSSPMVQRNALARFAVAGLAEVKPAADASLPGLTRQSMMNLSDDGRPNFLNIQFAQFPHLPHLLSRIMDRRVKPGDDTEQLATLRRARFLRRWARRVPFSVSP